MVHGKATRHTQPTGQQANHGELKGVGRGNGALAQAQHAQHGAVVQVVIGKTARRQRYRHGTEQRCQQGDEVEKFFGPLQRLAHFGAPALQRLDPQPAHLALFDLALRPVHKGVHAGVGTGHGQAVGQAAGGLNQLGGLDVGAIDHDARGKVHETRAPVGLVDDDFGNAQVGVTEQQRIAHFDTDRIQQRRLDPGLAGGGNGGRQRFGRARLVAYFQFAAQRVTRLHHLQGHQFAGAALGIGRARHGRKTQRLHHVQPQAAGFLGEGGRGRVVAGNQGIAAQQLPGISLQATFETVGKKTHRRQGRHRERHGHDQQTEFTRAQIAP